MSAPGSNPPGWYPDPWNPGGSRWWDGTQWGPPAGPPAPFVDIEAERSSGRTASTLLLVGIAAYGLLAITQVVVFNEMGDVFREVFANPNAYQPGTPVRTSSTATVFNLLGNLLSLLVLVVGVVFLIWFYRALVNVQRLGLRLPFGPGWGVGGFFIPIANFFMPYLAARELFAPDHPQRKLVLRWWLTWIGAQLLSTVAFISAVFSVAIGAGLAVVVIALYVVAGLSARTMIVAAADHHAELLAQGGAPGQFGPFAVPMGAAPGAWGAAPSAPWTPPAGTAPPASAPPAGTAPPAPAPPAPGPTTDPWGNPV